MYDAISHLGLGQIWAAAVDPHLTPEGLISPGLGDTVSNSMHGYTDRLTTPLGGPTQQYSDG
jgi:hypothetical protein